MSFAALMFLGAALGLALAAGAAAAPANAEVTPALLTAKRAPTQQYLQGFDPRAHHLVGDRLVADLARGARAELTLDPSLQQHMSALLRDYRVPFGAVVALVPATGKLLAYVSHSSENAAAGDQVRDVSAPSASVFKLVTAAALLDAGIRPDARICYGGGLRRLTMRDLTDNPRRDRSCATLGDGIGYSINAVLAKLADRTLDRPELARYAQRFGFGRELPFDAPVPVSPIDVPEDRLEFARTAAGFWHTRMSPLHGALLAATIANGGVMPQAHMVARTLDARGNVTHEFEPGAGRDVISRATARTLGQMMLTTVSRGTSREAFRDRRGRPYLRDIAVAGKTGTLSSEQPYRAYSWWVGFAPENAPKIAVAALIVNGPNWRIKASQVAREALHYHLVQEPASQERSARR